VQTLNAIAKQLFGIRRGQLSANAPRRFRATLFAGKQMRVRDGL